MVHNYLAFRNFCHAIAGIQIFVEKKKQVCNISEGIKLSSYGFNCF